MRALRRLVDDGLEDLGAVTLGDTLVAGDPTLLVGPVSMGVGSMGGGSLGGGFWGGAVRPGAWRVLGRPRRSDPDVLEEVILVHVDALAAFYDHYDAASHQAELALPTGRIAALDGALRTDADTLRAAASVDLEGLPWVLERGCVLAGIAHHPAQIAAPTSRGSELLLVAVGLARAPRERVGTTPYSRDKDEGDDPAG